MLCSNINLEAYIVSLVNVDRSRMIGCVLVLFNARPAAVYPLPWHVTQSCYKVNTVQSITVFVQSAKDELLIPLFRIPRYEGK